MGNSLRQLLCRTIPLAVVACLWSLARLHGGLDQDVVPNCFYPALSPLADAGPLAHSTEPVDFAFAANAGPGIP